MTSPLLVGGACSVINNDHCGNQDGNATCLLRDANTPYCSICVADNNGCLAEDPGSLCLAETAPATSVDPTTTTSPTTTTTAEPTTTGTTTPNPTTTTTDTTQTTEPVDTSTTTPDPTTGTSTGDTTTLDTTTTTGDATDTSTGDTTMSSTAGEDSESSSSGGPVCGNNEIEGDEVCDGTNVGENKCWTLLPEKWGGGTLKCNNCSSYNDTECCIGLNQKCKVIAPDGVCCPGLTCKADMLLVNRCLN